MALIACGDATPHTGSDLSGNSTNHYFDDTGAPLPQWDPIWDQVAAYFGSAVPAKITVRYSNGSTSQFSPKNHAIILGLGGDTVATVAHESTHLAMFNLTNGVSNTDSFRFFDEGFAEINGRSIGGDADGYKTYALAVAKQECAKDTVSFAKVQDWPTYFGAPGSDPSTRNWRSYQVGSSFVYMIQDTRGAEVLHSFFVDIGKTADLGTTFQNVFSSTVGAIEQDWLNYVRNAPIDTMPVLPWN